jgi:hypothetical protein
MQSEKTAAGVPGRKSAAILGEVLPLVCLGVFALVLLWTRLVGLDQSLQNDEIFAVERYIVPGPDGTLFGDYEPNDHVLFNLVTWVTTLGLGRSEALYRLWSVLPGMAAVGLLGWWCWGRLGRWTAVVFTLLAVVAPNHLELFKQARGYGLVTLAGAAMLVVADRFELTGSRRWLAGWGTAAFVGVYTHFGIAPALAGQAGVMATRRDLRRSVFVATAIVTALALVGYAPLLGRSSATSATSTCARPAAASDWPRRRRWPRRRSTPPGTAS